MTQMIFGGILGWCLLSLRLGPGSAFLPGVYSAGSGWIFGIGPSWFCLFAFFCGSLGARLAFFFLFSPLERNFPLSFFLCQAVLFSPPSEPEVPISCGAAGGPFLGFPSFPMLEFFRWPCPAGGPELLAVVG